jgi:aspartyl/asparaginyl-tRNA synthetase
VKNNRIDLLFFLTEEQLNQKEELVKNWPKRISFKEALDLLYEYTKDKKYKEFSLKNFWIWEEVKLTEILWSNVIVEKFPVLQIPFYHNISEEKVDWVSVAKNADFILYGYRETIWAGERVENKEILLKKAEIFNLPKEDYLPYLRSRDFENYEITSWFGMWWQRLMQWLTNQPYIYEATLFPRTHLIPNP